MNAIDHFMKSGDEKMNMQTLESFIMISDEGSFSSAARKLYITPTALIQKVNHLEAETGLTLFKRQYNGVVLTSEGRVFYDGVTKILHERDVTLEACLKIHHASSHTLRIKVYTKTIMKAWQAYAKQHPDIDCKYEILNERDLNNAFFMLRNDMIDVLEWPYTACLDDMGMRFINRHTDYVSCVVAADHPFAHRESLRIEDLVGKQLFTFNYTYMDTVFDAVEAAAKQANILLHMEKMNSQQNAVIDICKRGHMFFVGSIFADDLPLVSIPITPKIPLQFGLVCKKNATSTVRQFLEFALAYDKAHGVSYN